MDSITEVICCRMEMPARVITKMFTMPEDNAFNSSHISSWWNCSPVFDELLDGFRYTSKHMSLTRLLLSKRKKDAHHGSRLATAKEQARIDDAQLFLAGVNIEINHPINVMDPDPELNIDWIALADMDSNTIVLNSKIFRKGKKELILALFEEGVVHLDERLHDESRALQDFLFERLCNSWEEASGNFL
jgi:hypothetical protein